MNNLIAAPVSTASATNLTPLEEAVDVALYAGELLIRNGAETWRVEDTIVRLATLLGAVQCEVVATVTGITVSVSDGRHWQTRVKRVHGAGINLTRIDAINTLSRRAAEERLSAVAVRNSLMQIDQAAPLYGPRSRFMGSLLNAIGFCFLFGGGWVEVLAMLPAAAVITALQFLLTRLRVSILATTVFEALAGVLVAVPMARLLDSTRPDVVILSTVVLLVPGATIVAAIGDLLGGQLLSGLARGAGAALVAAAIAAGVALGLTVSGMRL